VEKTDFIAADCPITGTLQLLSKRWVLLTLRAIQHDTHTFNALKRALGGHVSSRTLTDRLIELEQFGILEKRVISQKPLKTEYHFTRKSQPLKKLIEKLCDWAASWEA
jgi:DNA-binding HxlR family transcriptional regulator